MAVPEAGRRRMMTDTEVAVDRKEVAFAAVVFAATSMDTAAKTVHPPSSVWQQPCSER